MSSAASSVEGKVFTVPTPLHFALPSPDSRRLAYVGGSGFGHHVFINGEHAAAGSFWEVMAPTFSSDSSTFGFAGQRWFRWTAVTEAAAGPRFADIGRSGLTLSADGRRIAYTAKKRGRWYALVDHEIVGGPYEGFSPGGIIFSPDASKYGFVIKRGNAWVAVVNGKEDDAFPSIIERSWTFSPNSSTFAYVACIKRTVSTSAFVGEASVICNGSVLKPFRHDEARRTDGMSDEIVFSPDSQRTAYIVITGGRSAVVVDGQVQPACDGLASGYRGHPQWQKLPNFGHASMKPQTVAFSPDSRHFAYAGASASTRRHVVILDGQEFRSHEGILNSPIMFNANNVIAYAACEGGKRLQFWPARTDDPRTLAEAPAANGRGDGT